MGKRIRRHPYKQESRQSTTRGEEIRRISITGTKHYFRSSAQGLYVHVAFNIHIQAIEPRIQTSPVTGIQASLAGEDIDASELLFIDEDYIFDHEGKFPAGGVRRPHPRCLDCQRVIADVERSLAAKTNERADVRLLQTERAETQAS